jgi:hypothetical protein
MNTHKLPMMTAAAIALTIALSACGKTSRESTSTSTAASIGNSCCTTMTSTFTNTSTSTSTNTSTVQDPPLSFSFNLAGNQNAITPAIQTDNVLKVKFVVGATQGNSYHSASELAVNVGYNSQSFGARFTSSSYTYGQVGETSNVIDLSSLIQPGSGVQITISNPQNDFYCTYAPNPFYYFDGTQYVPTNPLYNSYPGCRRAVPSTQQWSGTLIVQTSHTTAI